MTTRSSALATQKQCERLLDFEGDEIKEEMEKVEKFITNVRVLYTINKELGFFLNCDYMIDILASLKNNLCNVLVRGIQLIQVGAMLEAIVLIPFILVVVQGFKRWRGGGVSVQPA